MTIIRGVSARSLRCVICGKAKYGVFLNFYKPNYEIIEIFMCNSCKGKYNWKKGAMIRK